MLFFRLFHDLFNRKCGALKCLFKFKCTFKINVAKREPCQIFCIYPKDLHLLLNCPKTNSKCEPFCCSLRSIDSMAIHSIHSSIHFRFQAGLRFSIEIPPFIRHCAIEAVNNQRRGPFSLFLSQNRLIGETISWDFQAIFKWFSYGCWKPFELNDTFPAHNLIIKITTQTYLMTESSAWMCFSACQQQPTKKREFFKCFNS